MAWVIAQVRRRVDDAMVEITISLFTGYAAYLLAEELSLSGVIAAVTAGVYLGWRSSELYAPATRIEAYGVWEVLQFLLNAVLFVLVGLQLPRVLDGISGEPVGTLVFWGVLVSAAVIVTRLVWVFVLTYGPRLLSRRLLERDPYPDWRNTAVVAWSGMRGAVSLAAALAIPLTVSGGAPFPQRDLLIFLTFCVILATLVFQGLTLPPLIKSLRLRGDDEGAKMKELEARLQAARAALGRLDLLEEQELVGSHSQRQMRESYEQRVERYTAGLQAGGATDEYKGDSSAWRTWRRQLISAERETIVGLRNSGGISPEVMRRIERDLDLEESRIGG